MSQLYSLSIKEDIDQYQVLHEICPRYQYRLKILKDRQSCNARRPKFLFHRLIHRDIYTQFREIVKVPVLFYRSLKLLTYISWSHCSASSVHLIFAMHGSYAPFPHWI